MTKILKNVDFLKKMALKSVFMISPLFLDQIEDFFIPKRSAKNSLQTLQVSSNFEMIDVNRWRKPAELPGYSSYLFEPYIRVVFIALQALYKGSLRISSNSI